MPGGALFGGNDARRAHFTPGWLNGARAMTAHEWVCRAARPSSIMIAPMKNLLAVALVFITVTAAGAARAQWRGQPVGPAVRVRVAPPVVRREVRVVAPSPRHVWVGGYWAWQGRRHVWIAGHWELPPAPNQMWVEARWVLENGEWVFYPGYW